MFRLMLIVLFVISLNGYSQEYFYKKFSTGTINGNVYDILDDSLNNRVFIAGDFSNVGGIGRVGIASFDRTTGVLLTAFNANLGGTPSVKALTYKNGVLYFAGTLSTVGGVGRNYVAAVNASTGALNSWYPILNSLADDIDANGTYVLLSGGFNLVNGISRPVIAAVDPISGATISSFNANANNSASNYKMLFYNNSVFLTFNTLIAFNSVNRNYIAKLDASTGTLSTWNPNPNNVIKNMTVLNNDLIVVGTFTNIAGSIHYYAARLNLNTGACITSSANIFYNTSPFGLSMNYQCASMTTQYRNWLAPYSTTYNIDLCAAFEDIVMYNNQIGNSSSRPLTVFGNSNFNSVFQYDLSCEGNGGIIPNTDGFVIDDFGAQSCFGTSLINYERLAYLKSYFNRLYTINFGGTSQNALISPSNSKLESWVPLPKLPLAIIGNTLVCAGTKNHVYTIPQYKYTKSHTWNYNGTGVTLVQNDTSVTVDFGPNATSGKLIVHCIGEIPRYNTCSSSRPILSDSVVLNITVNPIPSVNAGPNLTLNCSNGKVATLNGTVTTSGVMNEWLNPSNGMISNNLNHPLINQPQGNYVLSSTITATGCSWRDTAYVYVDTLQPNLTMPVITNTRLCCSNPSVNLNASSSTPGVTYNWTNNNGYSSGNPALISTTSPTIPVSNMTYSLTVTNPTNGCTNKGSIMLLLDTVHPTFGLGVNTSGAKISCISTSAVLTGTTGVSRAKLYWNGSGLALNTPNPATVTNPTTYTLMAQDTVNGCQAFVNYMVIADTAKPVVNPLPSTKYITCDTNQVTLNATSPSVNTTFTWTPPVGGNLPNPSFVSDAGTYTLNATDINNGCTRSRYLTVIVDTLKPNISTNVDSVKLSCSMLSYTLNTNTSSSPVTIDWAGPGGFTSPNPATVTTQGFYITTVKNTFNGCFATKQIKVSIDSTKPYIVPFSNNFQVNCSYTTAVLSGTTIPANQYQLTWTGPAAFTSANPATVSNVGTYTFTALDTITGCKSIKEVNLNYQPVLLVDAGNDTVICNGSTAQLHVTQIGGTPTFSYSWSNGSTLANNTTTSLSDTTQFTVVVNDAVGCIGEDTVVVFVPDPIQDSSKTFLPCDPNSPLGQIQTFPYGGIPPYQFAIGSGTYQASNTFVNIPFGTHTISIKDNLGCTKTTTATIDNSSLRPEPNFLISTNMFKSDTFVVVDISNPRPDSVQWTFPPTCTIIDNSNPFSPVIVNSDTGTFVINMKAFFGTCEMNKSKLVHIGEVDTTFANGYNNNGIESITLYPNPNSGQFNVEVKLYKKQTFAIFIYNASSVEQFRQTIHESDYFNQLINIPGATSGSYVLKVVAEYDAKQKAFIISQ